MNEKQTQEMMIDKPGSSNLNQGKPLITFAIFAYNQEKFIREAVDGAFAQTYSPLEIILSDDCSKDKTFEIMEEMANDYIGPHHITLNRNQNNLGLAGHVNKVIQLAKGELIVIASGDDISMPDRVQMSWNLLNTNIDCSCLSFSTIVFKDEYTKQNPQLPQVTLCFKYSIEQLIKDPVFHIPGPSRAFRKSVFEMFGPLLPETPTEDSTILLRCLLVGSVLKSEQPQVFYRVHGDNYYESNNKYFIDYEKIHCQYMIDLQKALDIGLVDNGTFIGVKKSLQKKLHRLKIWSEFNRNNNKLINFIFSILFSKVFSAKEKKMYFHQALSEIKQLCKERLAKCKQINSQ